MVQATLHKDPQLLKKSARKVNKLLDEEIKKQRVRKSVAFISIINIALSPSWTMFSLLVHQLGVKRKLADLTITQEAF
jgi:hypothetical protein